MAGLTKCPDCGRVVKEDNRPGQHYVTYTAPCSECVNRKYQKRMDEIDAAERARKAKAEAERKAHMDDQLDRYLDRGKYSKSSSSGDWDSSGLMTALGGAAATTAAGGGCTSIISGCTTLGLTAFFFFTLACCCCGLGNSNDSKDEQQEDVNEQFEEFKAEQEKDAYEDLEVVRVK